MVPRVGIKKTARSHYLQRISLFVFQMYRHLYRLTVFAAGRR